MRSVMLKAKLPPAYLATIAWLRREAVRLSRLLSYNDALKA